jgi:Lar family restriction alleviation protein
MSELKPCPFCGCKTIRMHYSNNGAHSIYCNNCNVETCTSGGTDRCVTEWNTRAPQSEWISVDKAPLNKNILFFVNGNVGHMIGFKAAGSHKFISDNNKYHSADVLGWMPLPVPPKDGK